MDETTDPEKIGSIVQVDVPRSADMIQGCLSSEQILISKTNPLSYREGISSILYEKMEVSSLWHQCELRCLSGPDFEKQSGRK